jgi:hypothetical protein
MPVRIDDAMDLERWHARRVLPSLLCAIMAAGLSCEGDCVDGALAPLPPVPVHERYVLTRYGPGPVPATVTDVGTVRVRILADTLLITGTLAGSSGTYIEILVLGTTLGTAAETVARTTSSSRAWTRTARDQISFSSFGGGGALASVTATLSELSGDGQLGIRTADDRTYVFESR